MRSDGQRSLKALLLFTAVLLVLASYGSYTQLAAKEQISSSELGLVEVSPRGEAGGYAIPASGCSLVTGLDSHGNPCPATTTLSVSLSATPNPIDSGGATALNWVVSGATNCTASNGWSGSKNPSNGSHYEIVFNLTSDTTFVLTCDDGAGTTAFAQETVIVNPLPVVSGVSVTLTANPVTVLSSQDSILTWEVYNATNCVASGDWSNPKDPSDGTHSELISNITADSNYTLTCDDGAGNSDVDSASVTVLSGTLPSVALFANPLTVDYGASTQLTWFVANSNSCTASDGWSGGKTATNGQHNETINNITADTTYTLTCQNSSGTNSDSDSVNVVVTYPDPTITADPLVVQPGDPVTVTWDPYLYTDCRLSANLENDAGFISAGKDANTADSHVMNPTGQTTYTIFCDTSDSGDSVEVFVTPVFQET